MAASVDNSYCCFGDGTYESRTGNGQPEVEDFSDFMLYGEMADHNYNGFLQPNESPGFFSHHTLQQASYLTPGLSSPSYSSEETTKRRLNDYHTRLIALSGTIGTGFFVGGDTLVRDPDELTYSSNESNWGYQALSYCWGDRYPSADEFDVKLLNPAIMGEEFGKHKNSVESFLGPENSNQPEDSFMEIDQMCVRHRATISRPFIDDNTSTKAIHGSIRSQRSEDNSSSNWQRRKVISLDGGGIRGYASLWILQKLMEKIERLEYPESRSPKLSNVFDLVVGTSTGGLISIMLSKFSQLVENGIFHTRPPCNHKIFDHDVSGMYQNQRDGTHAEEDSSWILGSREYMDWRKRQKGCFWLSGSPGTGKSTQMNSITRHFDVNRNEKEFVVSYNVDADIKIGSPSIDLLGGILIELLSCHRSRESRQTLESLFVDLILFEGQLSLSRMKHILSQVRHILRSGESLCVLVDGLDEWGHNDEEQNLLFELVDQLSRHDPNHNIKCLFSAKPTFQRSLRYEYRLDLDIHISNRRDLQLYVHESLHSCMIDFDPLAAEDVERLVVENANGVFLWAELVTQNLLSTISGKGKGLSATLSLLSTRKLPTLYDKLFGKIQGCNQIAALSMLRWVTYASRPLHLSELLGGLNAETDIDLKGAGIIDTCAGLLCIDDKGIVRLVHFSVREYLVNRMKQNWAEISNEANEIIAHACLKVLSPERLLQSLGLSRRIYSKISATKGSDDDTNSFEDYAQQFWMFHYRLAESGSTFLAGMLHSALETSLRKVRVSDYKAHECARSHLPWEVGYESKPRLTKDEVEILEQEFLTCSKPTTEKKRQFAKDMEIELARINHWFQNRRAKAKQEKKQAAYEACQAQVSFPTMGNPLLSSLSYNPQYISPSGASMQSLHNKIAVTQAATHDPLNVGLLVAARFRLPKLLKLELEMGANVNFASGEATLTPLIWAAMSNNCEAVELLLQYGADPHLASRSGNAPLAYAVANGHNDVVKVLKGDYVKTEESSMDVSISTPCDTCKAAETMYKLTPSVSCYCTDDEPNYPAIIVKGEVIHSADAHLTPTITTTIKWFSGVHMHRALAMAARLGIEHFKALLVIAGNDTQVLNRIMSLSGMVSNMRI